MIKNVYCCASSRYSCQILIKCAFSGKTFEKYSNIKFHDNPYGGSRAVPCRQTWQSNSHFSPILRTRLKAAHSCRTTTVSINRFQIFAATYCLHFHRAWNPRHFYWDCWSLTGHNILPKDILHMNRLITWTFISTKTQNNANVTIKTNKLCESHTFRLHCILTTTVVLASREPPPHRWLLPKRRGPLLRQTNIVPCWPAGHFWSRHCPDLLRPIRRIHWAQKAVFWRWGGQCNCSSKKRTAYHRCRGYELRTPALPPLQQYPCAHTVWWRGA